MELNPKLYPSDPLMVGMWASALKVTVGNYGTMQTYRDETGDKYIPTTTKLDNLLESDKDSEDGKFIIRFINWFNGRIWGDVGLKAG